MSALRDAFPGIPLVESPLFKAMLDELDFSSEERRVALELHERGYAVIDFPDDVIEQRIERIKQFLAPQFGVDFNDQESVKNSGEVRRIQDAWVYNEDVRAVAANPTIVGLLSKLYGRPAFPFQTLNFHFGTQQHLHSDSIHFSSVPERFMCGVWLAMEDIREDAGPLTYLPGSHKWPIVTNAMIGRRGFGNTEEMAQRPFEAAWDALIDAAEIEKETFLARKGQALIWAANLLHGGSPHTNPKRTRWSQVTHYYFDDCIYYTPSYSDEALGLLHLRTIVDVATEAPKPNLYLGELVGLAADPPTKASLLEKLRRRVKGIQSLPEDFDADTYYRLNPDVALAKQDAVTHYLKHGKAERRRYKFRAS